MKMARPLMKLISTGAYPFLANDTGKVPDKQPPADILGEKTHYRCPEETVRRDRLSKFPGDVDTDVSDANPLFLKGYSINHHHGILCEDSSRIDCNPDSSPLSNTENGGHQIFPVDASSSSEVKIELQKKVSLGKTKAKSMNGSITGQNCLGLSPKQKYKPRKLCYSYSIPVSVNRSGTLGTPRYYSGPLFGRCTSKGKDNFSVLKTIKPKFERQISRLQSRRQVDCPSQKNRTCVTRKAEVGEQSGMPAGRYFAALKGPELEILKDSESALLPDDVNWPFLLRFPIGCFGIALGLGSQSVLWKALATTTSMRFLQIPRTINLALWVFAIISLITIFTAYLLKCIFYFEAVRREYYHPVRINFFFAPWIACMFLTLGVPPAVATSVHPALCCLSMAPIFILELKIYGQWLSGGTRRLSKVANPSTHLSLVGNFVGALLAATVGWKEFATFFWSVGLAHYLVLFVTLYQRLPSAHVVPKELHPVFFLFVAVPSTASIAWENIVGDFDLVSRITYFIGLFLYLSLVVRIKFFCGFSHLHLSKWKQTVTHGHRQFSVTWWAYTFPTTSSAIATIHYSHKITSPITQGLAVVLSFLSAAVVFALFLSTVLHAFYWCKLFPNDMAIAITQRRYEGDDMKTSKSDANLALHKTTSWPSSNSSDHSSQDGKQSSRLQV